MKKTLLFLMILMAGYVLFSAETSRAANLTVRARENIAAALLLPPDSEMRAEFLIAALETKQTPPVTLALLEELSLPNISAVRFSRRLMTLSQADLANTQLGLLTLAWSNYSGMSRAAALEYIQSLLSRVPANPNADERERGGELLDRFLFLSALDGDFSIGAQVLQPMLDDPEPDALRPAARFFRVAAMHQPEKYNASWEQIAGILRRSEPEEPVFALAEAWFYRELAMPEDALRIYLKAAPSPAEMKPVQLAELTGFYMEAGKFDEALAAVNEFEKKYPGEKALLNSLRANILIAAGRKEQAARYLAQEPPLGRALMLGDYKLARTELEKIDAACRTEKRPRPQSLDLLRLVVAEKLRDPEFFRQTRALLAANLATRPDLANSVGYVGAELNLDLKENEKLIVFALSVAPFEAAYLDSLAWVRFRQGDLDEAAQLIRRALYATRPEKFAELAVIYDHAGDIENARGNHKEAADFYKKALAAPRSADFDRTAAQKKLEALPK